MRAFVGPGLACELKMLSSWRDVCSRLIIMVWYRCIWKKTFFFFIYINHGLHRMRCKRWGAAAMA